MAKRRGSRSTRTRYANYRFELSDEGILLMQCHTDGGSLVWDWKAHDEMSDALRRRRRAIVRSRSCIHTGTGENYNANWGAAAAGSQAHLPRHGRPRRASRKLDEKAWYGRMLIENVLAVDVPMISAVNGPCNIHSEVPLLGDIVLASEDAYFRTSRTSRAAWCRATASTCIWPAIVGRRPGALPAPHGQEAERAGGARVGRRRRGAAQGPAPRPGVGARARAGEAASPRAALHPHAVHPGPQARLPRRAGLTASPARRTRSGRFFPSVGEWRPLDRPWDRGALVGLIPGRVVARSSFARSGARCRNGR